MRSFLVFIAPVLLFGCESVSSEDVATDALYAVFEATGEGSNVHATAILKVGGDSATTYVNLEAGDRLVVSADGVDVEMTESNVSDLYIYDADFTGLAAGTELTFRLEREVEDDALDNRCTLPVGLEVTAPEPIEDLSRATDDLDIAWSPSGEADPVRAVISGDCVWDEVVDVQGDPGVAVVTAGTLASLDEDAPTTCPAQVQVQRRRAGTIDPAFGEGGSITCQQVGTSSFTSQP